MFSQLTKRIQDGIEAVEYIAQSGVSSSPTAGPASPTNAEHSGLAGIRHTPSLNEEGNLSGILSSPSLAESAFSSIRRSLTIPRIASPSPDAVHQRSPSKQRVIERELEPVKRSSSTSLEDRLRASFAVGEASISPSPKLELVSVTPSTQSESIPEGFMDDPIDIPLPPSPPSHSVSPRATTTLRDPDFIDPLSLHPSSDLSHAALPTQHLERLSGDTSSRPPLSADKVTSRPPTPPIKLHPVVPGNANIAHTDAVATQTDVELPMVETPTDPGSKQLSASALSLHTTYAHEPLELPNGSIPSESGHDPIAERLKLVEQRFADVSASFKRLQAERTGADNVLRSNTPLQSISDIDALQAYLVAISSAAATATEDVKKLSAQLHQQNERMEELRDIHRLEGISRSAQVDKLQKQQEESNVLLATTESKLGSTSTELERVRSENSSIRAEVDKARKTAKEDEDKLRADLEKAQRTAKDEEEKRTKAISLLKTVRLKSVKTEKDLDEVMQERALFRGEIAKERDAHKAELAKLESEVEKIRIEKGKDLARLKAQFEAELAAVKSRLEKEVASQKSQFELDAINLKATHAQELTSKANRISQLEASVRSLSQERDSLFDQLQLRQAEVESSQSHLESLENQTAELRHLLREATDRASALSDELLDSQRQLGVASASGSDHGASAAKSIVADVERRYESKISDLRQRMMTLEHERSDAEEEWSRNLAGRSKEIDRLRSELATKAGLQSAEMGQKAMAEELIDSLQAELRLSKDEKQTVVKELALSKAAFEQAKEAENLTRLEQAQYVQRVSMLEKELEDLQNREVLLRASNKTLREELRKVQTSAALLERQRNPGVGYWAQSNQSRTNILQQDIGPGSIAVSDSPKQSSSPLPSSPDQSVFSDNGTPIVKPTEEDVNLEYLRNIILQFLEHKEMRPNLVRVMSVILRFTPAETRRLASKV